MNPSDPARLADLERRLSRLEDIEALHALRIAITS
jgi:CHAD domain-containing protein